MADFFKGFDDEARNRKNYLDLAEESGETELMRHGDRFPNYNAYGVAAYYKPATALVALRGVLGRETFHKAFTEYGRRWLYKHPSPYDFFHTVEDVSGRDLSWFWRTWFFETWKLDQAIDTVTTVGDSLEVEIANRGKAPMPVLLVVTRDDGPRRHGDRAGRRLARRGQADHGAGAPRAGGQEDRDRSGQRIPRRGPGQSAVAAGRARTARSPTRPVCPGLTFHGMAPACPL